MESYDNASIPISLHPANAQLIRDVDKIHRKMEVICRNNEHQIRTRNQEQKCPSVDLSHTEINVAVHLGPHVIPEEPHYMHHCFYSIKITEIFQTF